MERQQVVKKSSFGCSYIIIPQRVYIIRKVFILQLGVSCVVLGILLSSCYVYLSSIMVRLYYLRYPKPSQISNPFAFFDWWGTPSSLAVSTFRFAESFSLPTVAGDLDFTLAFPIVGPGVCCGCCI